MSFGASSAMAQDGSAAEPIPDNDPALILFEGPRADRKIALQIERVNGCH